MTAYSLQINGQTRAVDVLPDTPLLWVIRDAVGLTGTKFGCGIAQCGACTVFLDGKPLRSCSLPVSEVGNGKITTIEGVQGREAQAVQKAWVARDVPQCGYCQSGQIMQAAALLAKNDSPTREEVVEHMDGNLCRCMTYARIQRAVLRAATDMRAQRGA